MKARHIASKHAWRIALGIERDEDRLHPKRIGAQALHHFADHEQVGWADIRAIRETKVEKNHFAAEI